LCTMRGVVMYSHEVIPASLQVRQGDHPLP
jgi:hypothetical protein